MKKRGRLRGIELLERHYSVNNNWNIGKLYIELSSLMRVTNELCITDEDVDTRKSKLNQLIREEREFLQKLIDSTEVELPQVFIKTEDKDDVHEGGTVSQTPIKQEKVNTLIIKTPTTRSASKRTVKAGTSISDVYEKPDQGGTMDTQRTEDSGGEVPDIAAGIDAAAASNSTPEDEPQEQIIIPKLPSVSNTGLTSLEATGDETIINHDSNALTEFMTVEPYQSEDAESTNPLDDEDCEFVDDENDVDYTIDNDDDNDEDAAAISDVDGNTPKEPKVKKRKMVNKIKKESTRNRELVQCQECDEQVFYIRRHMTRHVMKQNHLCQICQLSFNTDDILLKHVDTKHVDTKHVDTKHVDTKHNDLHNQTNQNLQQSRHECNICKRSFLQEEYLVLHMDFCKEIQCKFCPATYRDIKEWKLHEEAHKRECFTCNITFDTIFDLTNHFNLEHPDVKTLTCFKCNSSHATILELARHCETHFSDENGLQCIICRRFFKFKASLIEHLRIHTGEKPHFCLKCSESFIRRSDFLKHLKDEHGEGKPEFCGGCGTNFPNKSSFWKHSRDTSTSKKCPHCRLEFNNCRQLRNHIQRHLTKEERKVFVCQYCGIAYTNREQLKCHINTHTGQKPFKCLICPTAFTSRSALQKHNKSHENQRAFQCEVCSKMFNLRADLNRHRRIHTAQKDWKCDVCNKSFNQAGNLKVHQRIHSGEKPYKCDVCGQEFMYKGLFNDHLKKHGIQTNSILNNIIKSENA